MELEELNKSQIVLLTLLVSFVTSIATGIVTVSLMEQAPTDVTRVIQKTVERTVEKVAPPEIQTKIVTQEKTVIVSDADLIANAVELNTPSIVRIYSQSDEPKLLALGAVISAGGVIATDASVVDVDTEYTIEAMSGTYTATVLRISESEQIALLELKDSETVPRPASISSAATKVGGSVVLLSGSEQLFVARGLVSELGDNVFATNLNAAEVLPGSVLINIDGNIVGINTGTSRLSGETWFVPARNALNLLNLSTESSSEITDSTSSSLEGRGSSRASQAATSTEAQTAAATAALEEVTN